MKPTLLKTPYGNISDHPRDGYLTRKWKKETPPGHSFATAVFRPKQGLRMDIWPRFIDVGTWNWRGVSDRVSDKPEHDTINHVRSQYIADTKLTILACQELTCQSALDYFQDRYMGSSRYPVSLIIPGNDPINIGFCARLPVLSAFTHRAERYGNRNGTSTEFKHDLLQVEMAFSPWLSVTMFVVHFSPKPDIRYPEMDSAEVLIQHFATMNPGKPYIVLGDFNEGKRSLKLQRFMKNCGLIDPFREERVRGNTCWNATWDHIGISKALKPFYVTGSAKVETRTSNQGSDHLRKRIQFHVSPFPPGSLPNSGTIFKDFSGLAQLLHPKAS